WPIRAASPVIALFGGDVTLSCLFPSQPVLNLQCLTLTWQKEGAGAGVLMVHSHYYEREQLARQDKAYRNRTRLDPEGLARGKASLSLRGVRMQDEGVYRCHVTSELGTTSEHWELRVGAWDCVSCMCWEGESRSWGPQGLPGISLLKLPCMSQLLIPKGAFTLCSKPQLTFSLSSTGVTLTVRTWGGYPAATVRWLDEAGRDIMTEGAMKQQVDEQGLCHVTSWVRVPSVMHCTRLTFVLTPRVLGEPITQPLSLELSPGLLGPPVSCLEGRLAVVFTACLCFVLLAVMFLCHPSRGPASSCSWKN
ncbi:unnamed protein product, partial [Natator depressus]